MRLYFLRYKHIAAVLHTNVLYRVLDGIYLHTVRVHVHVDVHADVVTWWECGCWHNVVPYR